MSFDGIHDLRLDAKNRLTVPARARPELAVGVSVAKGFEPCLELWPAPAHERIRRDALAPFNPLDPRARELRRHLYGNVIATELDSAGRITVPSQFLAYAGITKDVVVIGSGDYLELWDRDAWQAYDADLIARAADHIASIGHPA